MQGIMVNRDDFGIFASFPHLCANVLSFYFLFLCLFSYFGLFTENRNRKEKSAFLPLFCRNMSVFAANKTLIFSDL